MLLSVSAGLLLLVVGALCRWQQLLEQRAQSNSTINQPLAPITASVRAKDTRLLVDLNDRQVHVYRNGSEIARYPVAVGQAGWETPTGRFQIYQMRRHPQWQHPITHQIIPAGPNNPLGNRWIGFYQGEHMMLGFHGTPQETLVGEAVSHGCLRMRNQDIQALYDQVGMGTVVEVRH
jgi:lipoprotein-anchoring transpeptidase ErfK/SrfK